MLKIRDFAFAAGVFHAVLTNSTCAFGADKTEIYSDFVAAMSMFSKSKDEERAEHLKVSLEKFLSAHRDDPLALNNLAILQIRNKQFDDAGALLRKIIEQSDGIKVSPLITAIALYNKGGKLVIFHMITSPYNPDKDDDIITLAKMSAFTAPQVAKRNLDCLSDSRLCN
ncbi:MAG: tetratricopeptide repeat protein [Rhizobiaceae bacterium]